jgi:hypothetical protein
LGDEFPRTLSSDRLSPANNDVGPAEASVVGPIGLPCVLPENGTMKPILRKRSDARPAVTLPEDLVGVDEEGGERRQVAGAMRSSWLPYSEG